MEISITDTQGKPMQTCIACLAPFLDFASDTSKDQGLSGLCPDCRVSTPRPEKIHCRECGAVMQLARRGRPRLRCEYCERIVRSARQRVRRAGGRSAAAG